MVIDNLHNDRASLRQCSLVCKAWVPRCHSHMFEHMLLQSDKDLNRWKRIIEDSPGHSVFVKSFTHPEQRLRPLTSMIFSHIPSDPSIVPFQMLSQLSNLQAITITRLSLVNYPNDIISLGLPSVKSLTVNTLEGETSHHVLQFLSYFPNLVRLSTSVKWHTIPTGNTTFPQLPRLKHLRTVFMHSTSFDFFRLLARSSATQALQSLDITSFIPYDGAMNEMIASCSGTLISLRICCLARTRESFSVLVATKHC